MPDRFGADRRLRVAIAEDNPIYRAGLVELIGEAGFEVLFEAGDGAQLLARLEAGPVPDVVVLDASMAGRRDDGLVTALEIHRRHPGVGTLLLSAFVDAGIAERLFADGSARKGYMLKETLDSVDELVEAVRRLTRGQTYSDPRVVDELLVRGREARLDAQLTAREQAILARLAGGASNGAIAEALRTTTGAIEAAVSTIYNKLGVPDEPAYNRRVLVAVRWLRGQWSDTP